MALRCAIASVIKSVASFLVLCSPCFGLSNAVVIQNASYADQTNVPVSVSRVFAVGEIPSTYTCVRPYIDGVAASVWQCNKKNSWDSDGSLKFALIAFTVPSLSSGTSITVDFRPSTSTYGGGEALTKSEVLASSWNARSVFTYNSATANEITVSRDVRTILNELTENESVTTGGTETSTKRKLFRWRDGPVLTEWIVQDLSTATAYDFGYQWNGSSWTVPLPANTTAYASIHPWYVLTAYKNYPNTGYHAAKIQFITESPWTRKQQNQVYRFTHYAGAPESVLEQQTTDYVHTPYSTHMWEGWASSHTVPAYLTDHRVEYLIHSKMIDAYITEFMGQDVTGDITAPSDLAVALSSQMDTKLGTVYGVQEDPQYCRTNVGTCRGNANCCGYWTKNQGVGGPSHELAPISTHYLRWLYFVRNNAIPIGIKKTYYDKVFIGQALAGSNAPTGFRESRTAALYCGSTCDTASLKNTANEFGRPVSISAHTNEGTISFSPLFNATVSGCSSGACVPTSNNWGLEQNHQVDPFYMPTLLTGDYHWLQQSLMLAGHATGQTHEAGTICYGRNGAMGYMGWCGSQGPRLAAWKIRNIFRPTVFLDSDSPEKEHFHKIMKNTAAVEEGFLGLTTSSGALHYDVSSSTTPWKYGETIVRTRSSNGDIYTNNTNPLGVWDKRTGNDDSMIHMADSYDISKVNSINSPWMTTYYMSSIAFIKNQGYNWFNAVIEYIPRLALKHIERNPYTSYLFFYGTRKTTHQKYEVLGATAPASNQLDISISTHSFRAGATVFLCCSNLSWPNGWDRMQTTAWGVLSGYSANSYYATIVSTDTNSLRLSIASGWNTPTGSYPSCCTVEGKYKLYVSSRNSVYTTDNGFFQTWDEFYDTFHPYAEDLDKWPTWSTYRLDEHYGSYPDHASVLSSYAMDFDLSMSTHSSKFVNWLKTNTNRMEWVLSKNGDFCDLTGVYTNPSVYCGDFTWAIYPRPRIKNLVVTPISTAIHFKFTAPTPAPVKIALTTSTVFSDSRDTNDIEFVCNSQSCDVIYSTAAPATTYRYRITAGNIGGTTRTEGTVTTANLSGSRIYDINLSPPSSLGVVDAVLEHGPTDSYGTTETAVACASGCTVRAGTVNVGVPWYFRWTYRDASANTLSRGSIKRVIQ